jgi:hypothetical protein
MKLSRNKQNDAKLPPLGTRILTSTESLANITMKNILIFILLFPLILVAQVQEKNEKIKLTLKEDKQLVHFKSYNYILSFPHEDMVSMSKDLKLSYDFSKTDTIDLKLFINKMDSLGTGNWTNNFRLNKALRQLIDNGKVKLYSIQTSKEVYILVKEIGGHPAAGKTFNYKGEEKIVLEFSEAFTGTPGF